MCTWCMHVHMVHACAHVDACAHGVCMCTWCMHVDDMALFVVATYFEPLLVATEVVVSLIFWGNVAAVGNACSLLT